jgi:hypothetical protein
VCLVYSFQQGSGKEDKSKRGKKERKPSIGGVSDVSGDESTLLKQRRRVSAP